MEECKFVGEGKADFAGIGVRFSLKDYDNH